MIVPMIADFEVRVSGCELFGGMFIHERTSTASDFAGICTCETVVRWVEHTFPAWPTGRILAWIFGHPYPERSMFG